MDGLVGHVHCVNSIGCQGRGVRIVSHEVERRAVCGQIDRGAARGERAVAARGHIPYIGVCLRGSIFLSEAEDTNLVSLFPLVIIGACLDAAGHLQGDTGAGIGSHFPFVAGRNGKNCSSQ